MFRSHGQPFHNMRSLLQAAAAFEAATSRPVLELRTVTSLTCLRPQQDRQSDGPAAWQVNVGRPQSSAVGPRQNLVQYEGPLSQAVRRVKLLSVFSCASAFAAAPLILGLDSGLETLAAKASVASTLCCFGMFTTGLMHWFTGPYVHRLTYDRSTHRFSAKTMSLLARPVHTTFFQNEVKYPQSLRPNVTFQVGNRFFAIDVDNFPDRNVLAKLLPAEPP